MNSRKQCCGYALCTTLGVKCHDAQNTDVIQLYPVHVYNNALGPFLYSTKIQKDSNGATSMWDYWTQQHEKGEYTGTVLNQWRPPNVCNATHYEDKSVNWRCKKCIDWYNNGVRYTLYEIWCITWCMMRDSRYRGPIEEVVENDDGAFTTVAWYPRANQTQCLLHTLPKDIVKYIGQYLVCMPWEIVNRCETCWKKLGRHCYHVEPGRSSVNLKCPVPYGNNDARPDQQMDFIFYLQNP